MDQAAQADRPFEHDDRPEPLPCEVIAGRRGVLDDGPEAGDGGGADQLGLAQSGKDPAQFGSEDHNHHDREQGEEAVEQEGEALERVPGR